MRTTDGLGVLRRSLENAPVIRIGDYRYFVHPISDGIPVATAISLRMRKPMTIVRKKKYGLPGEVSVASSTGYATHTLYLNGIERGERVAFVDDVLSTGGTITAVARAVREAGAILCDALVVIEKGGNREKVEREIGIPVRSLVRVEMVDGKVRVR